MNLAFYRTQVAETVVQPMIDFIEEYDGDGYTREDVQTCEKLLLEYLDTLNALPAPSDEAIMKLVKHLVLSLNDLNEATDYNLIETDAREAIWSVIQDSAAECGLQDAPDDVTEEWRDW